MNMMMMMMMTFVMCKDVSGPSGEGLQRKQRYSSTQSRHYMEVRGQYHAPAAFTVGKEHRYALKRMLGGLQRRSGGEKNVLYLPALEHLTFFSQ
jgi:hypothetical protein